MCIRDRRQLAESSIVFQPGINEELAATACWGSQQTELLGEGKHDGVFSVWYGTVSYTHLDVYKRQA